MEKNTESNRALVETPVSEQAPSLWGALANSLKTRSRAPALSRADRNQDLPLSFPQQRLWFMQQADPQSATYNLSFAWRLTGELDLQALGKSLEWLTMRHESFRTNVVSKEGKPVQVIAQHRSNPRRIIELQHLDKLARERELMRAIQGEANTAFDLAAEPLLRLCLFRLAPQEHVLLMTLHHIVCDGGSLTVLFRELQLAYEEFSAGRTPSLPELSIQYADFACWQRCWVNEELLGEQLNYWKERLKGKLPVLELPTDRPRPARQSFRGARQFFSFSPELSAAIRSFRKEEKVTLFNCLLAAFKALLFRYTGQEDLLVGTPMANRNSTELQQLVGFFVNTVVLRTPVNGEMTFRQLLEQVQETSLQGYANQDLQFDRLVEELRPDRTLSYSPLFQVMFSFQSLPRHGLELGALQVTPLDIDPGTSKFDLTLDLNDTPQGLTGFVEYATDLFEASTIARFTQHLQVLLAGALQNPDSRLWQLPLLPEQERALLISNWNQVWPEYAIEPAVHELIHRRAVAAPDHPAIWQQGRSLSYGDLDRASDRLAGHLQALGVGPETMVGVAVERSFNLIIGILATLKAGGAFVPLDPEYPKERLRFMIEDTRMPVILTDSPSKSQLPDVRSAQLVCLDEPQGWNSGSPQPERRSKPTDLAYVIYTSGSTGTPKGVLVEHGALTQHCLERLDFYHYKPSDRLLQSAATSFDVAVEQIIAPLVHGAQLVLRDPMLWTAEELQKKLEEYKITIFNPPPAWWNQVAEEWARNPESVSAHDVRTVIVGGEEMQPRTVELWQKTAFNEVELFNGYGPSENIVTTTTFRVPPARQGSEPLRKIPIGRPIGNRPHYVLDRWRQPVPIGVVGELYVGGPTMARGYHNRPELTAERFLPDPFSKKPGARMYKTGDLVRYLAGGNLVFIGRSDLQVKIRGFRVELGEIESLLRQDPRLQDAVVTATEGPDRRLVAFYVGQELSESGRKEVRQLLAERLPDYMIPSLFVALPALPMTPSGKVDRKCLPIPELGSKPQNSIQPRTPAEKAMAALWCEVLKLNSVSVQDNFFELGGHSLLAIQIVSRLRREYPSASLQNLFEWPTIEGLSACLEKEKSTKPQIQAPRRPITPLRAHPRNNS